MQADRSNPPSQQQISPSLAARDLSLVGSADAFPWGERWLRGEEYGRMLERVEEYCLAFGMQRCLLNQHPLQIYEQPENGMVYYMEGSLQTFGFPRVSHRKNYRWKKMNFTTDLPKQHSIVTYLVASSIRKGRLGVEPVEEYRMHVVMLFQKPSLLLCHIRRVLPLPSPAIPECPLYACLTVRGVDFYALFAYIHNHHWIYE